MTPCQCSNDNFICHPAEGCICRHGFTGENCDESNILSRIATQNEHTTSYGVIVAVVLIIVMCVTIIVLLWLYYKRRVSNLKTEIAHVQYIADPHGFAPDRNHFDNPVYSYQGGAKKDNEQLLNNTNQIRNNLHKPSNTNLERAAKIGIPCCSTDEDDLTLKGAYNSNFDELKNLKNRDADATNPNIYHSIDKLDHVYAEIKQKDLNNGNFFIVLFCF